MLADLYGRKRSVVASFTVMGAAIGLMATSPAFASMMVAQAVWAVGWTLQSGAATAWVTDELPADSGRPAASHTGSGDSAGSAPDDSRDVPGGIPDTTGTDQLIVRHAIWRAVGLMVGPALAAGTGTWSLRGGGHPGDPPRPPTLGRSAPTRPRSGAPARGSKGSQAPKQDHKV